VPLGHTQDVGAAVPAEAAGIGITKDGNQLVVADYYNDSISVLSKDNGRWSKTGELDLRPGQDRPDPVGHAGRRVPVLGRREGE
jgi:DNA-binding beta-propeller fold protein YncE